MTETTSEPPLTSSGAEPTRGHVLVVDDDDMVRNHVVRQVVSLGYVVSEAANGEAALEILRQRPDIDLLFTDIVMGRMSGLALAVAAEQLRPDLPILFTSGNRGETVIESYNLNQPFELLPKPYGRRELAERLQNIFQG